MKTHPSPLVRPSQRWALAVVALLAQACAQAGPSWPTEGLTLWLQADQGVTADAGQKVSAWADQSAKTNHLAQGNASLQPLLAPNSLNGLPVLQFRDDWLSRASVPGTNLFSATAATLFVVQRQLGSDNRTTTFSWVGGGNQRYMLHATYDDTLSFQVGSPDAQAYVNAAQPPGWDDAWHLVAVRRDGTNGVIRVDRVAVTQGTVFKADGNPAQAATLYLGNDQWGNTFNGDIAEVLSFSAALSDADLASVESYLAAKWALPVAPAAVPDLAVKTAAEPDTAYAGNGVYQSVPSGVQVRSVPVAPLRTASFRVRAENDAASARTFTLRASESTATGWSVVYRVGDTDVTGQLVGPSGYAAADIAPGAAVVVSVEITMNGVALPGGQKTVELRAHDTWVPGPVRDVVRLVAEASPAVQPDLLVRREVDPVAAGAGVFNADGTGQTRWQEVLTNQTATYSVTLANRGNTSGPVRLTAPAAPAGWTARYEATHALVLDGGSQYVDLGAWAPGTQWSVEAWVRPSSLPGGRRTVIGSAAECRDWGVVLLDGKFAVNLQPPGGCSAAYKATNVIVPGTWYHVAATADGTNACLYVNGKLEASGPAAAYVPTAAGARIGSEPCCGNYLPGAVREARIWNRALAAEEVAAGMLQPPEPGATGLAGYWRLDEAGGFAHDLSPARRHGVLVNGPVWERTNITALVTGPGWADNAVAPGAATELVVTVTPDATVTGGSACDLLLAAAAVGEPARNDAIRMVTTARTPSTSPVDALFTSTADFEKGWMSGVDAWSTRDQLQLSPGGGVLPYLWVPNSSDNTVSKVDTRTGRELARYRVAPSSGVNGNPSRTTVDLRGNCWVANRNSATVVKIGLLEYGGHADRNGDGIIQTSRDLNGDGVVSGSEILEWGQDECVLHEVVLQPGAEARYTPGTYRGTYPNNYWNPGPRGLAVDAQGNLWAGTHDSMKYYYIDGETGQVLRTVDTAPANHTAYGAAIDPRGILWSSGYKESGAQNLLRLDTADGSFAAIPIDFHSYGMALDRKDHLFVSAHQEMLLTRWSTLTGTREWTVNIGATGRGVAVTDDGDVWVVGTSGRTLMRYSNDGVAKAVITVGGAPTGVAVDAAGKLWVMGDGDEYLRRIDPATDSVDLTTRIAGSHYGYSDMTGILARNSTVRLGVWSAVHDAQVANTAWEKLVWHAVDPAGNGVSVRVRSSNDRVQWSAWETAASGQALRTTPPGRYLEFEVTLRSSPGQASPSLQDIAATGHAPAPTDVAVLLSATPNPVLSEYPQACAVTITNLGTSWASGVRVTNRFPAFVDILSVSVPGGYYQRTGNEVVCTLGGVGPKGSATIAFATTPLSPGSAALEVSATANEPDPNPANNAAALVLVSQQVPCTDPPPGLVAWWSAEGDARDSAGTNHLTVSGGPTYGPGKTGSGFVFDSNDDRLSAPHNEAFNLGRSGFTAAFWMNGPAAQPAQSDNLVTLLEKSHGWTDSSGWAFQVYPATGTLSFGAGYGGGTGNGFGGVDSAVGVLDGRWHHVAGTWDGYVLRLYLDGALQGTTPLVIPASNTRPLNIGFTWGNGSPRRMFRGGIDEVVILDRALGAEDLAAAYAARSGGYCRGTPFVSRPPAMPDAVVGQPFVQPVTAILGTAPFTFSKASGTFPPGLQLSPDGVLSGVPAQPGSYAFAVKATDAAGKSAQRAYTQAVVQCVARPPGLVGRWSADEMAEDSAGTNHGVLEYNAGYAPGRVGKAFVLDGNEDAIRLPGSSTGPLDITGDQLSIMAWLNIAATNPPATGYECIVDKYWDGSATGYQLVLNQGRLQFNVATATTRDFGLADIPFPLRRWVHVAATYDGTNARVYLDGVQVASAALKGAIVHNTHDMAIGNDNWPGSRAYALDGLVDEVEVYRRGLEAAEVQAAFAAGSAGRCFQPWSDLLVKDAAEPDAAYSGDNAYQAAPDLAQTRSQTVAPRATAAYDVKVQNDSAESRAYALKAVESAEPDWDVVYRVGGVDVSQAMRGTTGFRTAELAPGASQLVRVEVRPGWSVAALGTKDVVVASYRDGAAPTVRDSVRLFTVCAASRQPDLMVRRDFDDSFAGEGVQNMDGTGQTRRLEVAAAQPAVFQVLLRNQGNTPDRIRLTGNTPEFGWTASVCGGRPYLEFNGANQFVRIPDGPAVRPASLTIEGWYNFSAIGGSRVLFSKAYGGGSDDSYVLWHDGGALRGYAAGIGQINYAWSPALGTWYHLAYVFDDVGNRHSLLINGVEVASGAANASLRYDDHAAQLGADFSGANPSEFFPGRMAEVRFWNVARTAAQVRADRNHRLAGNEPGLVGYWRLDDGTGDTAADTTANGLAGTLFNGPVWGAADTVSAECFDLAGDLFRQGGMTVTLGPKETLALQLVLTPDESLPTGYEQELAVTAASLGDPSRVDRVIAIASVVAPGTAPRGETYTLNRDFERGRLSGVEYSSVPDQLQLAERSATLRYLWVPSNEGFISKIDTLTGRELARYRTVPASVNGQPSRTTVDLHGNCHVANRFAGTVVKLGLLENGQYVDRNGDGLIQTSADTNGDGDIGADEMLAWGKDECVLWEVSVIPGLEGTFTPGTFPGPYRNSWGDPGPRGIAVDAQGNVWLGTLESKKFYHIDGETGAILRTIDVSPVNHRTYGAVIDRNGILWSSSHDRNEALRLDPATGAFKVIPLGHFSYGINVDREGHVFVSGWQDSRLTRIDSATAQIEWSIPDVTEGRGIAITDDGDVWVAHSGPGVVVRRANNGALKATIPAGNQPSGVAVDSRGMVWVVGLGDPYVRRIDPARNVVDFTKLVSAAYAEGYHYGYSDMTGAVARNSTTRIGFWNVVHDSGWQNTPWGAVSWQGTEPEGTSIRVRVRSSNDRLAWSLWQPVENGLPFHGTPPGRYLEVEASLQSASPSASPVLQSLTVTPASQADYGLQVYANGFEQAVGPEWSASRTGTTPAGARRFLGEFGNETITLTLSNLPPHVAATVMVDQFVIRTWDGNSTAEGPDVWELNVAGGLRLLHTTFNNGPAESVAAGQAYPGTHPGNTNPARTGALENNTLGFAVPGVGVMDAVYQHIRTFPHTAGTLVLNFAASGLSAELGAESWGLDNVRVFVTPLGEAPRLVPLGWEAGGFAFQFGVEKGWTYVVEGSTDLVQWTTLATSHPTTDVVKFVDQDSGTHPYRFYRVRKEQ